MDREKKRRFTLIRGGGETAGAVHRSFMVVDMIPEPPEQLGRGVAPAPRGSIVSLGLDGLRFQDFQRILQVAGIRHVVDTRILAAFRGNGFKVHLVERLFEELQVQYDRPRTLENPFTVSGIGPSAALKQYAEHLRGQWELLRDLGRRAEQGPLLLLGRAAEHSGSERELIAEEMARVGIAFRLLVARKQENAVHLLPWPVKAVAKKPASVLSTARRSRPRTGKTSDAQVPLPFSSFVQVERGQK